MFCKYKEATKYSQLEKELLSGRTRDSIQTTTTRQMDPFCPEDFEVVVIYFFFYFFQKQVVSKKEIKIHKERKKFIISSFGNGEHSFPYKINNGKCAQILNSVLLPCECARAYWAMHQKIIIRYLIFSPKYFKHVSRRHIMPRSLFNSVLVLMKFIVTSNKTAVSASFYSPSSFLDHTSYLHFLMLFAPVHIHPVINVHRRE